MITPSKDLVPDFPSGAYRLRFGLVADIRDSATPLERPKRQGKCAYTRFSAATCGCWSCRGLSQNPTTPEQRTPRR